MLATNLAVYHIVSKRVVISTIYGTLYKNWRVQMNHVFVRSMLVNIETNTTIDTFQRIEKSDNDYVDFLLVKSNINS